MNLDYSNPFNRTSKFQLMYASMPSSLSTPSLLGPSVSICPRKKYSKGSWYDYKSSNLQLSQKVVYRMNAQFHRLQALDSYDAQEYEHLGNCLMSNQCKKNPFNKKYLLTQTQSQPRTNYENQAYWTSQKSFIPLQFSSSRNYFETTRQYGQLKRKIQGITTQKLVSNNSLFGQRAVNPNKITFGDEKFVSGSNSNLNRKQTNSSGRGGFESRKNSKQRQTGINLKHTQSFTQQKIRNLGESKPSGMPLRKQLSKQSSNATFAFRGSYDDIPQKITYENIPYYFVKLVNQNEESNSPSNFRKLKNTKS